MRQIWRELVTDNPMLIEIYRYRRRFFSFSGGGGLNGVVLGLCLVCYVGLLMLVFSARGAMPPGAIILAQTFVFTLIAPSMLYGSVAGEREKRTWDMLIAAPVTQGQIVAGKLIGALMAMAIGFGLFALPILITAIEYDQTNWYYLLLMELVSASFIILVSAVTIFFSGRCRKGFMALGAVLGTLTIFLLIIPIMTLGALLSDPLTAEIINFFHPFVVQTMLMTASDGNEFRAIPASGWGWPQILAYLSLSIIFILWAGRTLGYADNDVKFIPRSTNA